MSTDNPTLRDLFTSLPQIGQVEWIGLRPARREAIKVVESVEIDIEHGLIGDRYTGKPGSKRMVTLIQAEHIEVVAKLLKRDALDPALLRRNIVVSGINLLALKAPARQLEFKIGDATLQSTGNCHPCSRMEEILGIGGYNAMRGHGGITTTVVASGTVKVGDTVSLLMPEPNLNCSNSTGAQYSGTISRP